MRVSKITRIYGRRRGNGRVGGWVDVVVMGAVFVGMDEVMFVGDQERGELLARYNPPE